MNQNRIGRHFDVSGSYINPTTRYLFLFDRGAFYHSEVLNFYGLRDNVYTDDLCWNYIIELYLNFQC